MVTGCSGDHGIDGIGIDRLSLVGFPVPVQAVPGLDVTRCAARYCSDAGDDRRRCSMTVDSTRQVIDAYFDAMGRGDDFGQYFAEQVVWTWMETGERISGRDDCEEDRQS